ncbi:MAG: hypothetical protein ABI678_12490 [Kofleriaceae bacterium]
MVLAFATAACTQKANQCSADSDCKDIAYPFCDVDGQFAAAGAEHNVCTIVPPNCPVDRCGCDPGATRCEGAQHTTCAADGKSEAIQTCALGCASTGDRCATFKPSNGLDVSLNAAAGMPDVVLASDITVDTDTCSGHDASNVPLTFQSQTLSQTSAPGICVFVAGSFDLKGVNATGDRALAFVSPGPIVIRGTVDGAARKRPGGTSQFPDGPGAVTVGACVGAGDDGSISGGGGNATPGADGLKIASIPVHIAGGLAQVNFSPLIGGCRAGGQYDGGGGGGALQLVSADSITLSSTGLLAFGGAGGRVAFGGGSGGTIVLEAPAVTIAGNVTANGGGGSFDNYNGTTGCEREGADATNDAVPAPGGVDDCDQFPGEHGGAGGTGTIPPSNGTIFGGGGGAVGRILIRTADGTFTGPGAVFSVVATSDTLLKQ